MPFLLQRKKRYLGLKWVSVSKAPKIDAKGGDTVRRETAPLVRDTLSELMHILVTKGDVTEAVRRAREVAVQLLRGDIELSQLILSKSIANDTYKSVPAHVQLARRIEAREPGTGPVAGDRVPYVFICKDKSAKVCERIEQPEYAIRNGLELDYRYYLERQLAKPVARLLAIPLRDHLHTASVDPVTGRQLRQSTLQFTSASDHKEAGVPGKPDPVATFATTSDELGVWPHEIPRAPDEDPAAIEALAKTQQRDFEKLVERTQAYLFAGLISGNHSTHERVRVVRHSTTTRCRGCKVPLETGEGQRVCASCKPREAELFFAHVQEQQEVALKQTRIWAKCQRCAGTFLQADVCCNQDCRLYWQRMVVGIDLRALEW